MNSLFTSIIRLPFARKTWVRGGILFSLVLSTGVLFGCKTPVQTAALNAAKGQEELSCRFDEISLFNGDYLVKKDKLFGLYSISGDIIIPCEFDQICFFNGDYLVKKGNKQSLYNADGQEILP
ncbi:WG repeat-containing protein [Bacteroides eggerthii]|uniref:WG repeat-containing protein n=1 Tax=Bacteroides eggerthii TaxID=28111 RepID=A0ABT7U9T2_9BACE|nr:WG repeat-containing protein [Bacteroides eggerthii]